MAAWKTAGHGPGHPEGEPAVSFTLELTEEQEALRARTHASPAT
jgi:hypothetical protein